MTNPAVVLRKKSSQLRKPVLGACEHDPLVLCQQQSRGLDGKLFQPVEPTPPTTAVVDAAVELFAQLLPLQEPTISIRTLNTLLEAVRSSKLEKNIGRRVAVTVNASIAIVLTLRNAMSSTHAKQARDDLGSTQITSLLSQFLMVCPIIIIFTMIHFEHSLRSSMVTPSCARQAQKQ